MRNHFLLILTVFLFIQSCALTSIKKTDDSYRFKTILADTSKSYIYRTNLSLYDNDFSGMLIIKPQKNNHRVVFINEIGMKFFDFEFSENDYKINHIFEPMNKNIFVKLLINDFRFILMNNLSANFSTYKDKKSDFYVIKPKNKKELYYFNNKNNLPKNAIKYSIFRKNIFLNYEYFNSNIPKIIRLKHKNVKFNMDMEFVK